jgi:hypothetical protein
LFLKFNFLTSIKKNFISNKMDSYDSCYKKYTNNNLFMIKDLRSSRARSKVRSIEREQSKDYEENKSQLLFKGDLD